MYSIGCILTTNKRADLKERGRGPGQCRDPALRPLGTCECLNYQKMTLKPFPNWRRGLLLQVGYPIKIKYYTLSVILKHLLALVRCVA